MTSHTQRYAQAQHVKRKQHVQDGHTRCGARGLDRERRSSLDSTSLPRPMRSLVEVLHHLLVRVVDASARLGRDLGVAKLEKVIEERRGDGVVCKRCKRQECEQAAQVWFPRRRWEVKAGGARRTNAAPAVHACARARTCTCMCVCACVWVACACGWRVRERDCDVARRTDHGVRGRRLLGANLRPRRGVKHSRCLKKLPLIS